MWLNKRQSSTYYYSILAEIYKTVGYDFYEHTLPHGAKVHEYLDFNYRLLKDFTLTKEWAKHNVGSSFNPYNKIKKLSQEEFQKNDEGKNVTDWDNRVNYFVNAHKSFVSVYMPHLDTDVSNFDMGFDQQRLSANMGVDPYMLYIGNLE